jgi:DNA-binding beta-propeller fold protein YncE
MQRAISSGVLASLILISGGSVAAAAVPATTPAADANSAPVLKLLGRTDLPGYTGDFDHLAADVKGNRLLLAAEDHSTLEIFDLKTGTHLKTLKGFDTPHSILLIPDKNQILVTDGTDTAKLLDATTYQIVGGVKLTPGADSIGYDPTRKHLYVVTGGKDVKMADSWLTEIDLLTGERIGDVKFDANHVEAMAVEHHGPRLYINVTDKNYMAVVDKDKRTVVARWPIHEAKQNAALAFDEADHRLFVITRQPGKMIVLNSEDGSSIVSFNAPARVDEAIFDTGNHRIYAPGGEGYIGVYQQKDPDHYAELAHVPSAAGAKTAVLVPELNRLYVAVSPGEGKTGAALIWFDVAPL